MAYNTFTSKSSVWRNSDKFMATVYVSTYDIDMTQCRAVEWFDHQFHFVHLSESCLVCFSRALAQHVQCYCAGMVENNKISRHFGAVPYHSDF